MALAAIALLLLPACATPDTGGAEEDVAAGVEGGVVESEEADGSSLTVTLEGNENISRRLLRKAAADALIVLKRERQEYQADDAAYMMEEYCRGKGFHRARVGYTLDASPPREVVFDIREGPRAVLGEVVFEGRDGADHETLMQFLVGPTTSWIGGKTLFVRSHLDSAVASIRTWYRSQGHLKAEVDPPEIVLREVETIADLKIAIRLGPQYTIKAIQVEGSAPWTLDELLAILDDPLGQPFTTAWPTRAERTLVAHLRRQGRLTPQVDAREDLDHSTGEVRIVFSIQPGKIRTVGNVVLEGQDRTELSFLRSLVTITPGDTFNGDRVRETTNKLYETALFKRVTVEETPIGEDSVDITFRITERDARDLAFLVGYGSYELARASMTYTDRNIFGRGLVWSSGLRGSFRSAQVQTSLTDPSFLGWPVSGTVEVYAKQRQFPSFDYSGYGTVASLKKTWRRHLTTTVGYSFETSTADSLNRPLEIQIEEDQISVGSLFTKWALDYRDSRILPTSGSLNEVVLTWADESLASDLGFHRVTARSSWLFPIDEEAAWVLAFAGRAGVIIRQSDTDDLPLQYRFFNGGEDSVRSFREDELGPQVQGDPEGGEFFSTLNAELRTPLYRQLKGTLFADGGNVIRRRSELGLDDYRFALGLGLRYDLPIGPIRLDWGWNPNRRSGEQLWALHLSVGFPF